MTVRHSYPSCLGAILFIFVAAPALAQTGNLKVKVFDAATRQPLVGVTVTLSSSQWLIAPTMVLTDQNGLVEFPVLKVGRGYAVEVSMDEFGTQSWKDLRIQSRKTGLRENVLEILLTPPTEEVVQRHRQTKRGGSGTGGQLRRQNQLCAHRLSSTTRKGGSGGSHVSSGCARRGR